MRLRRRKPVEMVYVLTGLWKDKNNAQHYWTWRDLVEMQPGETRLAVYNRVVDFRHQEVVADTGDPGLGRPCVLFWYLEPNRTGR